MTGKSKCKILKQIRQQIADENDIAYVTSECKYQGDCTGTCPKCESEVRYLENELEKRRKTGKKVVLAGIAAATIMGLSACGSESSSADGTTAGTSPESSSTKYTYSEFAGAPPAPETEPTDDELVLEGDVMLPPEDENDDVLMGEPVIEYPGDDDENLGGDPIWDVLPGAVLAPPSEDDETEETLPPFVDEEPGVDTGDWGPLF